MSKHEKYVCDVKGCNEPRAGDHSVMIYSHSTPDAAGGQSDEWQVCADLCPQHLLVFTQHLIGLIEDNRLPIPLKSIFDKLQITTELR